MKDKSTTPAKNKKGRKSKYCPKLVEKICGAIAEGKRIKDACLVAGISDTQFHFWMNQKADFADAVKNAKQQYTEWESKELVKDAKKSLRQLICGEEYVETTTEYENDGSGSPRIKKQKTVTKRVQPNITAIIFALTNRDPENWKNRISQDVNGKIQTENKSNLSLSKIPDELLDKVIECLRG